MKLSEVDQNLAVNTTIAEKSIVWLDATKPCFRLYGVLPPEENCPYYHRIPQALAAAISPVVEYLNHHTSGGRVRFLTDSRYMAIHTKQSNMERGPHMTLLNNAGFDVYIQEEGKKEEAQYAGTLIPPYNISCEFDSILYFPDARRRIVTLNMPLYGGVDSLMIGLDVSATLENAPDYADEMPVVYYGSSITEGGCASRPGNSYESMLSRVLDEDFINLGFSGNAKGETCMAEYIASLPMRAFVLDYDHNAPTPEHLLATHENFFRIIRSAQPTLPILMVSRPKRRLNEEEQRRRQIILDTYHHAVANGDANVYYLDGTTFFDLPFGEAATVDNCHPNDFGFACMAEKMLPILKEMTEKNGGDKI